MCIQTARRRVEVKSRFFMFISTMHLKTARRRVEVNLGPYSYLHHALKNFSSLKSATSEFNLMEVNLVVKSGTNLTVFFWK